MRHEKKDYSQNYHINQGEHQNEEYLMTYIALSELEEVKKTQVTSRVAQLRLQKSKRV